MSNKVIKELDMVHPVLVNSIAKIQSEVINKYNAPFRLFETGRDHDRHQFLIIKGRTKDIVSRHLYNLENDPPLYCTAVDYVYFNGEFNWNLRNTTIYHWYVLFGNLVLDACPELNWGGLDRRSTNFNHFYLRRDSIVQAIDEHPCVVP